ncbi:hypothetical protein BEH94_06210 [Candidatus Altiarchaeales archaeon WOR_SM1_SCG]|nr:hypothetical protein BEH94_06210 [Candidatus Altiarchaeales archaeon WOR_SM1_SCG]
MKKNDTCNCGSCIDCTNALNDSTCYGVNLTTNLTNQPGTCINNPENFNNKTFDCQGHMIDGNGIYDEWPDIGIYLNEKSGNIIRSCIITNFEYGISLRYSSNNDTLINNTANSNYHGIHLSSSSNNTVLNNTLNNNSIGFYMNSSSNSLVERNRILNNNIGIYSENSNSTTNSNFACRNTNLDFNSSDWFLSSGDNNTCDNPDRWNDANTTGCTYVCPYCSTCDECEEKLNSSNLKDNTLYLMADITNYTGTCINNPENFNNKTFDGQGHTIAGFGGGVEKGIYLNDKSLNTIKNCVVTDFYFGIYLSSSSGNKLTGNTANDNSGYGIYLNSSSSNTLTDNTASSNNYGIYVGHSSNNTLTGNIANSNYYGIGLWESTNNTITSNTVSSNNYSGIVLWNDSKFNEILNNEILNNDRGISISNCEPLMDFCHGGNTNNTIQGNEISNNGVGIQSVDSNSTINSNIVCGNTNYDFNSSDWKSSSGDDNTCNKPDRWNDTGASGCTYVCPYCSTCDECEEKLNSSNLKDNTLYLMADITNYTRTCINNPENFNNKIFDCQGYKIDGCGDEGEYGIYLNGKSNNTVRNCIIAGFYSGIYLNYSNNNNIIKNIINSNNHSGIHLISSSNSTLQENEILNNSIGIYSQNSTSVINSNLVCRNSILDFNSSNWYGSYGNKNKCDTGNWTDEGFDNCWYSCSGFPRVCDINQDGIITHDYNDLMTAYKCFLGIKNNCNKINFRDWNSMKEEYKCFTGTV